MPIPAMLAGAVHQPVDLALGEMAPLDCQVYDAWCSFFGSRFHRNKAPILEAYWLSYTPFLHSQLYAVLGPAAFVGVVALSSGWPNAPPLGRRAIINACPRWPPIWLIGKLL